MSYCRFTLFVVVSNINGDANKCSYRSYSDITMD